MRTILSVLVAMTFFFGGVCPPAYAGEVASKEKKFVSIGPLEAKKLIEERQDLLLIDVRSPKEFQQGALPGSTLIPFWDITKGKFNIPKDKPILLVCAVGGRSYAAGQYLRTRGYDEIYNLSGGLQGWAKQRVPLPGPRVQAAR